ncbi:MAG TPA: CheR family methyltransferase [Burkholderiaceae bacterium]|jgi:chemotaxis protein methyltransferase CheR|nr:CheR family methyltransferase [Burkholderiaceae bacterium]
MTDPAAADFDPDFDLELHLLVQAILLKYQYDFTDYALSSMRRRVQQALTQLGCGTVSQLQDRVLRDPAVFAQLLQFLTVQVSEMFRDPGYFAALREHVLPVLRTYPSLKVWIAGCASGEELYSLAILLSEEGLLERTLFYATDINPEALRAAQEGVYPLDRIAGFSENYRRAGGRGSLSDYYSAAYGRAVFERGLRAQAVFSDHSLATDSVFSEVNLVSCRNVLIYFNRSLQDRAIGLFRDALVHRGFLGLGSKESLRFCAHADAFEPVAGGERIYRKK